MKIQTPPGMRDFYPEDMRLQNWLFDQWRAASRAFGFAEYEGPIFEFLDLYTLKSGEEIVSQLFNFEDRGGRRFAIRPEMTPTLARMIAARANALPRPIKWFSIPRMCRAEKPQRGRLREFFQWNIDVLGTEDPLADAEVIAVAVDFLKRVGLTDADVVVRLSSRPLAASLLRGVGVEEGGIGRAFELLDRRDRIPPDKFAVMWAEAFSAGPALEAVAGLLEPRSFDESCALAERAGGGEVAAPLRGLREALDHLGAWSYCALDLTTVRGLAYYTGVVFEVHARNAQLRALLGGGRYDNLVGLLGGPAIPGVGFGMGDAPMIEMLREVGKLPDVGESLDLFVIDADESFFADALRLVGRLRESGLAVDFSYKRAALGKQLRAATGRNARFAVIVGQEFRDRGEVAVKNLANGEQRPLSADALAANPREALHVATGPGL
jgi:histidyl-tRNA synthetase